MEQGRGRWRRTNMHIKAVAAAFILLGSCTPGSPETGPSALPSPAPKVQSSEAPAAWVPPESYSFELKSSCGERSLIGHFHVVVKDGEVRAKALDERARSFMRFEDDFGGVPSIEALLKEVEKARGEDADLAEVTFAPDGHPTSIDIDYNEQAIDDEACYEIANYEETTRCKAVLCISDATVAAGQEVTIVFAPPKDQIWGVSAELRPSGKKRIAWLSAFSDDERLRTVWPGPNIGFPDIGFYGRAEWTWAVPRRLESGAYEISKESIRDGTDPIEERINDWTVSFEVMD